MGMGRGIGALLSKAQVSTQESEEKTESMKESLQFESGSVVEKERQSVLESETPKEASKDIKPGISIGRGRGLMISKLIKPISKPSEEVTIKPPVQLPVPTRPKSPELHQEVAKITSKLTSVELIDEIIVKPVEKKSDSGSIDRTSVSAGTRYISIATVSSRAAEELKIEEIQRMSPVRKIGTAGRSEKFCTNYVRLKCKNKGVYQYVVHYDPPCDSQFNRIKILYQLDNIIGRVRLFDGFTLFLPILLPEHLIEESVERNGIKYKVRIQLTKILPPENVPPVIFNIIFKNIMKELKMTRIGQHYFSPARQVDVAKQGLQVWPGFTTAVHDFEDGLHLVIDVAHKVLRTQTCWQIMQDLRSKFSESIDQFKQEVINSLCGTVVLTKYNNRTYKIDDILWEDSPKTEFKYHTGESISYVDYYKYFKKFNCKFLFSLNF